MSSSIIRSDRIAPIELTNFGLFADRVLDLKIQDLLGDKYIPEITSLKEAYNTQEKIALDFTQSDNDTLFRISSERLTIAKVILAKSNPGCFFPTFFT